MFIKLFVIITTFICSSALLVGCSFQKDPGLNKQKTVTDTPQIPETEPAGPKTVLEALLEGNSEAFDKYLATMSPTEINDYQRDGSTLLEIAVRQSYLYAVERLLEQGALPLKPRKNSDVTPLALAEKMGESISSALQKALAEQRLVILKLIQNKQYRNAIELLATNYMKTTDSVTRDSHILDLVLAQETSLTSETISLVTDLLKNKPSLAKCKNRLLELAQVNPPLFLMSVNEISVQNLALENEFILKLIKNFNLDVFASNVEALNTHKFFSGGRLADFQKDLLDKLIASLPAGQILPTKDLQRVLSLVVPQARDRAFCSACVEQVLTQSTLNAQRGDIIRLLILNSDKAPEGFIRSLLGRLAPDDFRQVVDALSLDVRQSQLDAFQGPWTLQEYQILKGLGMRMAPQQTATLLRDLFERRLKGDHEARQILTALSDDWSRAHGLIPTEEQIRLFTQEFLYAYQTDLAEGHFLNIISSIQTTKVPGLLMGVVDDQQVWLSPAHLFKFKEGQGMSHRFELHRLDFAKEVARIIPDLKRTWFLKTQAWEITEHDLLWVDVLQKDAGVLKLLPQLQNELVRELFEKWTWRRSYDLATIKSFLKATNQNFLTPDLNYRSKHLPALLVSGASPMKINLLRDMLEVMPENTTLKESSYALEFVEFLNSISDEQMRETVFAKAFLPYLQKQSPRLALALQEHSADYILFVAGDLSRDPLCDRAHFETYKSHCKSLSPKPTLVSEQVQNSGSIDLGKRIAEIRQAEEHRNKKTLDALANEKINISALVEVSKLAPQLPLISSFFQRHDWILRLQFFSPRPSVFDRVEGLGR